MVYNGGKVTRTYSTRGFEKKFIEDSIKANKLSTAKRRRLNRASVVEDENLEVVDVGEGEDIDFDIVTTTERKRKEIHDKGRTRSYASKSRSPTGIK